MVRAQRPVHGFGPFCSQSHVLEDGGLEVERLVVECPPVEPEAGTLRIVLRGSGKGAGFYILLGGFVSIVRFEAHCMRGLIICLFG